MSPQNNNSHDSTVKSPSAKNFLVEWVKAIERMIMAMRYVIGRCETKYKQTVTPIINQLCRSSMACSRISV